MIPLGAAGPLDIIFAPKDHIGVQMFNNTFAINFLPFGHLECDLFGYFAQILSPLWNSLGSHEKSLFLSIFLRTFQQFF